MYNFIRAGILGLIEGATEFVPVSSTGHLIIFGDLLNFSNNDGRLFEIAIQFGAALAVCFFYRKKIFHLLGTAHKDKNSRSFLLKLLIAFLPSVFFGGLFYNFIKQFLFSVIITSISLIIGGIIILIVEKIKQTAKCQNVNEINLKTALKIGLCQAISMIPGISRSGATIMGGMVFGLDRKIAAEFSFFLAVPTIFAAAILNLYRSADLINTGNLQIISVGFSTSFISSFFIIKWLLNFVSKHSFDIFGYYRIIFGGIVLLIFI